MKKSLKLRGAKLRIGKLIKIGCPGLLAVGIPALSNLGLPERSEVVGYERERE